MAKKPGGGVGSRVGPGVFTPGPLTEPDLWTTHPALQVATSITQTAKAVGTRPVREDAAAAIRFGVTSGVPQTRHSDTLCVSRSWHCGARYHAGEKPFSLPVLQGRHETRDDDRDAESVSSDEGSTLVSVDGGEHQTCQKRRFPPWCRAESIQTILEGSGSSSRCIQRQTVPTSEV